MNVTDHIAEWSSDKHKFFGPKPYDVTIILGKMILAECDHQEIGLTMLFRVQNPDRILFNETIR